MSMVKYEWQYQGKLTSFLKLKLNESQKTEIIRSSNLEKEITPSMNKGASSNPI